MPDAPSLSELAAIADEYYALNKARLAEQKRVDEKKTREMELRQILIDSLDKSDAKGVAGQSCRVTVVTKPVPSLVDREAFFEHVRRRSAWDLLNWSMSDTAVKQRWDDGKDVPGVEVFNVVKLSVNKL